jgi:DHA2 family multidrug resistance protein-like MFS transporter
MAPAFTMTTDLIIGSVAPEKAGAASGIAETSTEFGGALGIAVLGSVITAIYRSSMADVGAAGASPEALNAARDTLGAAVATATQLPAETGIELLAVARQSFTKALQLTMALSAVIAAVAAVLALVLLRRSQIETAGGGTGTEPAPQSAG